jgi:hypothetical protein
MSTVFGKLTLTRSDNAALDGENLTQALNKYSWSDAQQDTKWSYSTNDDFFEFESSPVEDPTGLPKMWIAEIKNENTGEIIKKNFQEMTSEDYENLVDTESDDVNLKDFANAISSFIKEGFIQITCNASDRKGLNYWEQITVNSDGTGFACWEIHRANGEVVNEQERF